MQFQKKCTILRRKLFKFFWPIFIGFILPNPRVISNKIPWSIQSSKQQSFTVLINIFPHQTSAIAHLYGCGMAEFYTTEYSDFIYKKKHSSYQCLLVGERSISFHNGIIITIIIIIISLFSVDNLRSHIYIQ